MEQPKKFVETLEIPQAGFLRDFLVERDDFEKILKKIESEKKGEYAPPALLELLRQKTEVVGGMESRVSMAKFGLDAAKRLSCDKNEFSERDKAILQLAAFVGRLIEVCPPEELQKVLAEWLLPIGFTKKDLQLLGKLVTNAGLLRHLPTDSEKIKSWAEQYKNQKEMDMQLRVLRAQALAYVGDDKRKPTYERVNKFILNCPRRKYRYQTPGAAEDEARVMEHAGGKEAEPLGIISIGGKIKGMESRLKYLTEEEPVNERLEQEILSARDDVRARQMKEALAALDRCMERASGEVSDKINDREMAGMITEIQNELAAAEQKMTKSAKGFEDGALKIQEVDEKKFALDQETAEIKRTAAIDFLRQSNPTGLTGLLLRFNFITGSKKQDVETQKQRIIAEKEFAAAELGKDRGQEQREQRYRGDRALTELRQSIGNFAWQAEKVLRKLAGGRSHTPESYSEARAVIQRIDEGAESYQKALDYWKKVSVTPEATLPLDKIGEIEAALGRISGAMRAAEASIEVSTACQLIGQLNVLYMEEMSKFSNMQEVMKKMKLKKALPVVEDTSLSPEIVLSNKMLFVPTRDEFARLRKVMHWLQEKVAGQNDPEQHYRPNIDGLQMVEKLLESRTRFDERTQGESALLVSHFTPRKNALKIIESGHIRAGTRVEAEASLSPQGQLMSSEAIAFSVWGTEPGYSAEEKEFGKMDPKGIGFVLPYAEAVGHGNGFYEYYNSQGREADELHVLDEGRGLSIENAFVLVHEDEREYWEKQFRKNGYSAEWIKEHFVEFSHIAELDDLMRFSDSPLVQKAKAHKNHLRIRHERGDSIWNERIPLTPITAEPIELRLVATPLFRGENVADSAEVPVPAAVSATG